VVKEFTRQAFELAVNPPQLRMICAMHGEYLAEHRGDSGDLCSGVPVMRVLDMRDQRSLAIHGPSRASARLWSCTLGISY